MRWSGVSLWLTRGGCSRDGVVGEVRSGVPSGIGLGLWLDCGAISCWSVWERLWSNGFWCNLPCFRWLDRWRVVVSECEGLRWSDCGRGVANVLHQNCTRGMVLCFGFNLWFVFIVCESCVQGSES